MFTDITVIPMSEVRTVAMLVYVSVTTETSFEVKSHFERWCRTFLDLVK